MTWTFVCIVKRILINDGLAGKRLQDHWSSGSLEIYEAKHFDCLNFRYILPLTENKIKFTKIPYIFLE